MQSVRGIFVPFHTADQGLVPGSIKHEDSEIGCIRAVGLFIRKVEIHPRRGGFLEKEITVDIVVDNFRGIQPVCQSVKFLPPGLIKCTLYSWPAMSIKRFFLFYHDMANPAPFGSLDFHDPVVTEPWVVRINCG